MTNQGSCNLKIGDRVFVGKHSTDQRVYTVRAIKDDRVLVECESKTTPHSGHLKVVRHSDLLRVTKLEEL